MSDMQLLKQRFVNQERYQATTINYMENVLKKAIPTEEQCGKDISQFNQEEYNYFLLSLEAKSLASLTVQNSVISKYIEFAIQEGFVPSRINIAELFNRETLRRYVSNIALEKKFITPQELDEIIKECANASDACLFSLMFEGVKGEKFCELINMMGSDVNFETAEIKLRDVNDNISRTIKVTQRTLELIQDTLDEQVYVPKNGEQTTTKRSVCYVATTPYVFRPAGKNKINKASSQLIMRRLKDMANYYGNPFLTATNIWMSGLITYTKVYKDKEGKTELTMYDYQEICKAYGHNPSNWYNIKTNIENII